MEPVQWRGASREVVTTTPYQGPSSGSDTPRLGRIAAAGHPCPVWSTCMQKATKKEAPAPGKLGGGFEQNVDAYGQFGSKQEGEIYKNNK